MEAICPLKVITDLAFFISLLPQEKNNCTVKAGKKNIFRACFIR
jgi:hypothetical protein